MREPAVHNLTQVVTLPAEVDFSNDPHVATWLMETLDRHPRVVIADLSVTEFCDTSGIRLLILASQRLADQGTELRIVLPSPHVRRTIHFAGVENVLRLYPSMAAAQAGQPCALLEEPTVRAFVPRQSRWCWP